SFSVEFHIAVYSSATDNRFRMYILSPDCHQATFVGCTVQCECLPHDARCTACSYEHTYVRVYTWHVHNHDEDKHTDQAYAENEQVLCFQSFELDRSPHAFIDIVIAHNTPV